MCALEGIDPFSDDSLEQLFPGYKKAKALMRAHDTFRKTLGVFDDVLGGEANLTRYIEGDHSFHELAAEAGGDQWSVDTIETKGVEVISTEMVLVVVEWHASSRDNLVCRLDGKCNVAISKRGDMELVTLAGEISTDEEEDA